MQNSTSTIIALFAAVVFAVVVPVVTLTTRSDNVTQENVKKIVEEFVTDVKNTGVLSDTKYEDLQHKLDGTGNKYVINIEIKRLDENPGKKLAQANYTKIGENVYYSEYTSQIENVLFPDDPEEVGKSHNINLKEGDIIYVSVSNENKTASQTAKGSLLKIDNEDEEVITASSSGMVNTNGAK